MDRTLPTTTTPKNATKVTGCHTPKGRDRLTGHPYERANFLQLFVPGWEKSSDDRDGTAPSCSMTSPGKRSASQLVDRRDTDGRAGHERPGHGHRAARTRWDRDPLRPGHLRVSIEPRAVHSRTPSFVGASPGVSSCSMKSSAINPPKRPPRLGGHLRCTYASSGHRREVSGIVASAVRSTREPNGVDDEPDRILQELR